MGKESSRRCSRRRKTNGRRKERRRRGCLPTGLALIRWLLWRAAEDNRAFNPRYSPDSSSSPLVPLARLVLFSEANPRRSVSFCDLSIPPPSSGIPMPLSLASWRPYSTLEISLSSRSRVSPRKCYSKWRIVWMHFFPFKVSEHSAC